VSCSAQNVSPSHDMIIKYKEREFVWKFVLLNREMSSVRLFVFVGFNCLQRIAMWGTFLTFASD